MSKKISFLIGLIAGFFSLLAVALIVALIFGNISTT